jgi:hypothetical protein
MNRPDLPVLQVVCVVPQHFADDLDSPTCLLQIEEPVRLGSRRQQIAEGLRFFRERANPDWDGRSHAGAGGDHRLQ